MNIHAIGNSTQPTNQSSGEYKYKISNKYLEQWKSSLEKRQCPSEIIPKKNQITFSWCNINVYTRKTKSSKSKNYQKQPVNEKNLDQTQKHILKNVSGIAHPGELLLIMGSSGAGKTTLLNCMTFRNLKNLAVSGLVCIDGFAVTQTELAAKSAYVQQDDLFIKYLTVKEHLIFQALVRMDSALKYSEKMERVEKVMRELSLKKCENCRIGLPGIIKGISGGERKRLAFASELLTNPSLLFCDEPTTGLDSFMSLNVVQMLKDIAATGRTVITTLHQPSSELFHMFDRLCLMAEGRIAFLGNIREASTFFTKIHFPCPQNFNPADHYIQTLSIVPGREKECRKIVEEICKAFSENANPGIKIQRFVEKTVASAAISKKWSHKKGTSSPYRVGWWCQMKAVFWRSWLCIIRDPEITTAKFYLVLLESLLITIIYYGQTMNQLAIKNIDGVFFFFLTLSSYQNLIAVLDAFCEDLPMFIKEHKDGMYRTDVYFLSKIICDLPLSTMLNILKTALCYYFIGLNPEIPRFLTALLISVLLGQAARGAGILISTIAPNLQFATISVSFLVSPLVIFGGFYLNISSIPFFLRWFADLSWFRYAYEAFMINQWSDIDCIQCNKNITDPTLCISNGMQVLQSRMNFGLL